MVKLMMVLTLQFIDVLKSAAEMGSQALELDIQLLELVSAGCLGLVCIAKVVRLSCAPVLG